MHEGRFMWAIHVVHHSSEHYNLSTALRQPVADVRVYLRALGIACRAGHPARADRAGPGQEPPVQVWIHTDRRSKLGPFEDGFNTASHHRVHHGQHGAIPGPDTTAASSSVWDRLFGTFERAKEDEPVFYGLTKNIDIVQPGVVATHEHADMLRDVAHSNTWSDRFGYVVRGPGWAYARHAEMDADPTQPDPQPATAGVA